ncbi:MAG: leucine-rich repeat protein [Clostridia bacterium]|nr:leucine-rich repeat protein [Clostridia bacterium]
MKKLLSLLICLILALSLLLTSCVIPPLPDTGETPDNKEDGKNDDENNNNNNENNNNNDNETPVTPPEVILPTLPDVDEGEFGTYTTYYRLACKDDAFTLYAYQTNDKGEFRAIPLSGTFTEEDGNYTLTYENGEVGYGKYYLGNFTLTDKNFVSAEEVDARGGDGVTEVEITPSQGGTDFGYKDLANEKDGKGMQAFYRDMLAACKDFATNTADVGLSEDYYKLCELNFAKYNISAEQAQAVWSVFRMENPAFYWLSSTCYFSSNTFILTIDEEYSVGAYRSEYNADIQNMLESASNYIRNADTDLERALLLHDFLALRIDYAYKEGTEEPETASWAHNILGAARVGYGVCETYAKTYQFLCQSVGIPTLFVTGYAGEPHAWNLIYIDGEWVGVDVTWDDMDGAHYLTSYFGMSASALAKDHTQDATGGKGSSYHYKTPTISPFGLSLCTITDDDGNTTLCKNLDTALALITAAEGEYIIKYYNYTKNGAYTVAPPDITYYISDATFPECTSLFIGGAYYTANTAETKVNLAATDFTLNIPVMFEDTVLLASHPTHRGLTSDGSPLYGQGTFTLGVRSVLDLIYAEGKLVLTADAEILSATATELSTDGEGITVLLHKLILTTASNTIRHLSGDLYIKDIECLKIGDGTLHIYEEPTASLTLLSQEAFPISLILQGGKDAHLTAKDFLTLGEYSKGNDISVSTLNGGKLLVRTDYFAMNDQYTFVLKDITTADDLTYAGNTLLAYTGNAQEFTLPEGVTHIGAYAFAENDIPFITIPDGITHICRGAFYGSSLTEISLPDTLVFFDATSPEQSYAPPAPVQNYIYRGTYAEWARMIALSGDFVLYFATKPNLVCTDGNGMFNATIPTDKDKPLCAVSDPIRDIHSQNDIAGKRMHHIAYNEEGEATITIYDVYANGAYGQPTTLAVVTMTKMAEGRYSFKIGATTYYIAITNGVLTYTDSEGNPSTSYPN